MRTTRYASGLLLLLFTAACNDALSPTARGATANSDVDVNDPRGELIAEVRYDGQLRSNATPIADNDCQFLVNVNIPNWSGNAVGFCEGARTALTSPGTFSSNAWVYDGYTYPSLTDNIPVVVTAGQTTRQVYELKTYTGIVTGLVTVDGQPAKGPYSVCLSTGGCSSFPNADGRYALLTKAGSGTGVVRNSTNNSLATFSYTATQGESTELPDIATTDPKGTIVAEVRYNGQFFNQSAPVADNDCQFLVNVNVPPWSGNAVGFCERTRTATVVPGTYSSNIWIYDGYSYPTLTENIPVVITNGQTTTQVYDLAALTSRVSGKVLIDGAPATSAFRVCLSTGGCSSFQRGNGQFVLLTKPGSGTGVVLNNQNAQLGSFTYSTAAGEDLTVADVPASDPRGTLTAEVKYNGAFYNPSAPIADNDCQFLVNVGVSAWSGNAIGFCERTRTTTVAPGTYGSNIWIYDGYGYPTLTGNIPVVVTNGQTTTQVYDLGPITAIVTGRVTVNGQPATSAYRVCLSSGGCSSFPHADGRFKILTKPGNCTGAVINNLGTTLVTFDCGSTAGEDTDVGNIGDDNTPPDVTPTVTGTLGANGWYRSDVSVSWNVADGQSAVAEQTGCGPSSVTSDVANQVFTCSARSTGGTATKSVTVNRDATAPVITFSGNGVLYGVDQTVSITCSASDAMSGLASSTCPQTSAPAYQFATGATTISASAEDRAGNVAQGSTTFTVKVTGAGLCGLVKRFVEKAGVANSMCVKLDGANPAINAFMNEVRAQSGKSLSSTNAAVLLRLAAEL